MQAPVRMPFWGQRASTKSKGDMDRLRIAATAHGLNYLPQHLADDVGMFARRGLEVTVVARQPWSGALDDLSRSRFHTAALSIPEL